VNSKNGRCTKTKNEYREERKREKGGVGGDSNLWRGDARKRRVLSSSALPDAGLRSIRPEMM